MSVQKLSSVRIPSAPSRFSICRSFCVVHYPDLRVHHIGKFRCVGPAFIAYSGKVIVQWVQIFLQACIFEGTILGFSCKGD